MRFFVVAVNGAVPFLIPFRLAHCGRTSRLLFFFLYRKRSDRNIAKTVLARAASAVAMVAQSLFNLYARTDFDNFCHGFAGSALFRFVFASHWKFQLHAAISIAPMEIEITAGGGGATFQTKQLPHTEFAHVGNSVTIQPHQTFWFSNA